MSQKPTESSLESEEEEVDLGDPDKDNDWGEVTDDDVDAEYLYYAGLFSDDHEGQDWIRCITCSKWAHTDCVDSEIENFLCHLCDNKNK
jgi:hypothetical protein